METEHISLIVTSNTVKAHEEAKNIYGNLSYLISPIIKGMSNIQLTFFIAPDGSFKGNTGAAATTTYRERFNEWCRENKADYTEVKVNYYGVSVESVNQIKKSTAKKEKEAAVSSNWLENKLNYRKK